MAREKEGIFDDRIRIEALEDEVVKLRKMVESQLEQSAETGVKQDQMESALKKFGYQLENMEVSGAETGVKQDQMESALKKVGYQLENIEVSCGAARQREAWQRNRERDVNRRRREIETKLGGDHDNLAAKVTLLEKEQKSAARKVSLIEEGQRNKEWEGKETNYSQSPKNPQNPNPAPTTTSPAWWNTYCCNIL